MSLVTELMGRKGRSSWWVGWRMKLRGMQALILMGRAMERKQGMDENEEKLVEALWY